MLEVSRRCVLAASFAPFLPDMLRLGAAIADEIMFPENFVWGASTSSYQIEGAVEVDGRGESIWDVFSHSPGRIKGGDTGDVACDHYPRWPEDIELLSRGGFADYRFSVAWSRILPEGAGAVEQRGLDFYDRLVDGLAARAITPWLCLYHWDLPQALEDKGGWRSRDTAQRFADYAGIVARRLGDRVKHWITFNEPNVHALFGYGLGEHAPGVKGLQNMLAAMHHQNLAHGRAVPVLRSESADARIGTVVSLQLARPASGGDRDRLATARFDAMWNGACLDPQMLGRYPEPVAGDFASLIIGDDLAAIHQKLDFIGMNYYAPMYVEDAPASLFGAWFGALPPGTPVTAMGWPVDPGSLTEELVRVSARYNKPDIYITENGACYEDLIGGDGQVHDAERSAYLRDHIAAAQHALAAGVNLRGYFVWSLLDNFEWAEGYRRRFGIVRVDFTNLTRKPKASYQWLSEFIAQQKRR